MLLDFSVKMHFVGGNKTRMQTLFMIDLFSTFIVSHMDTNHNMNSSQPQALFSLNQCYF